MPGVDRQFPPKKDQSNKQTNKQINKRTNKQTNKQTSKQQLDETQSTPSNVFIQRGVLSPKQYKLARVPCLSSQGFPFGFL